MAQVTGGALLLAPPVKIREPIPVGPFLEFCVRREATIRRELDCGDSATRLVMSFGWDPDHGLRKLNRWRNPDQGEGHSGWVDRAEIEDALSRAGSDIHDVYDVPSPPPYHSRLGSGRYMTDRQLVAAHTLYVGAKLTTIEVAALIQDRFGYQTVNAAEQALRCGWRALGLDARRCSVITRTTGKRCRLHPLHGVDYCVSHRQPWSMPVALVGEARALHATGASFNEVGKRLIDQTPWNSAHYLAMQLARLAAEQGWHRTRHLGCRARVFQLTSEDEGR